MTNIVSLTTVKPDGPKEISPYLLEQMDELVELMKENRARGFAAVAVCDDGSLIPCWYGGAGVVVTIGAIEILKTEFLMSQWMVEVEE